MTITANIIKDSINAEGHRLTTFLLRYPKFIHAELMTHRVFSRSASSSRAIPVDRLIADMRRDPAMPIYWGSNKPGMQAGGQIRGADLSTCRSEWLAAMESAIESAQIMRDHNLHKQVANRVLEPFAHINVLVTSVKWANWYALRDHPDAQPEIQALAKQMKACHDASTPTLLDPGEWHLPFVTEDELDDGALSDEVLKKVSTARCARTSYLTHDQKAPTIDQDLKLYDKLITSQPLHASPAEHQACPDIMSCNAHLWGNFVGWIQYRKMLEHEEVLDDWAVVGH